MKFRNQYTLAALISAFFVIFGNIVFFKNLYATYGLSIGNILAFISLALSLFLLVLVFLSFLSYKYTTKSFLIIILIISSFVSYFMSSYNIVVNHEMIRNVIDTDLNESLDLLSFKLVLYITLLGLIPSIFVLKAKINYCSWGKGLIINAKLLIASLCIIAAILFCFSKFYTSFFREHKELRMMINPIYWVYSTGVYIKKTFFTQQNATLKIVGLDAKISASNAIDKKKLVIMVVGEALRADKLPFNGYHRETMPLLSKEDIINFPNFYSCGTSTAVSVPCMFSIYDRNEYEYSKGINTENILDVLKHTGEISVLWRDNNSSSKGVATRVDYEDFRSAKFNPVCDDECRDEGMLVGLEDYISNHKDKNILIILHQMGNHGPAYYKRYPKRFEEYLPVCKTNQLEDCSSEEINNAYDNSILYTDYFLSQVIGFLKQYSNKYNTAMIYMSDHGESLGEAGIYLHGLPYFIAPDEQKHIASLMWFGNKSDFTDLEKIKSHKNNEFSHDNLFDTLLGLFAVDTNLYNKDKDILSAARKQP